MDPVFWILIAGIAYTCVKKCKSPSQINTGSKPRTNVFSDGKDYANNIYNVNLRNGVFNTKGIGRLGTPKTYVYDHAGVLHEIHLPAGSSSGCACHNK